MDQCTGMRIFQKTQKNDKFKSKSKQKENEKCKQKTKYLHNIQG
jgi:hypothetical protein